MITSDKWETLAEIHSRTGLKAEDVIAEVKAEFRSKRAVCRIVEDPDGYGQLIEFCAKPGKASSD